MKKASQIVETCIQILKDEDIGVSHLPDRRLLEDYILRCIKQMQDLAAILKKEEDKTSNEIKGYLMCCRTCGGKRGNCMCSYND